MNNLNTYNHYINVNSKWRLTPQQIDELQQKGYTQKVIGDIRQRTDRTIRYWKKWTGENLQKRGRKLKIANETLELLLSYDENNNTATLRELSDYLFQQMDQRFSQATIFWVLKKHSITLKKAEKQYSEEDEEKVKKFIKDNRWIFFLPCFFCSRWMWF